MIVHTDRHIRRYLFKGVRNGMEPRDPVVVVFGGRESKPCRQLRIARVDAIHLVYRHLPLLEFVRLLVLCETANQQLARNLLLISQASRIDSGKAKQPALLARQPVVVCLYRVVAELVVVSLVANDGSKLRTVLEARLPIFAEERIKRLAPFFD